MFGPFLHTVGMPRHRFQCKLPFSPAIETDLVNANEVAVAKSHGGTHKSKDVVVSYPSVAERVGKYELKDKDKTMKVIVRASHQTFQSVTARCKPGHRPRNFPCSLLSSKSSS
jgi:hypothetical protein